MAQTDKPTRTRRSPADIAAADLDAADKRVKRASDKVTSLTAELERAKAEETRARAFRDYAAKNPDLPENSIVDNTDAADEQGAEAVTV